MPTKSPHVADPALAPFLRADFDPAEYLNYTLPALTSPSSLASLSSETQTLLATHNTQATRLTQVLTQLTDEILRSGSRLAYQVDVLRGESITLNESLAERLKDDINVFAPGATSHNQVSGTTANGNSTETQENETYPGLPPSEPSHIARLRLLSDVRARLEAVIQLFGAAIAWPAPPNTAASSSFISVSAPPASEAEEQANKYAESLKVGLLNLVTTGEIKGALSKVEELKQLSGVWKGTAEEKTREKLVAELTKLVDDKMREQSSATTGNQSSRRNTQSRARAASRAQQQQHQVIHAGPYLDGLI
jgi:hypothetical protein